MFDWVCWKCIVLALKWLYVLFHLIQLSKRIVNETLGLQLTVDNQSLIVAKVSLSSQPVIVIDNFRKFTIHHLCPVHQVFIVSTSSLLLLLLLFVLPSFPFFLSLVSPSSSSILPYTNLSSTIKHQALPGAGTRARTVAGCRGNLLHTDGCRHLLLPQVG